MTEGTKKTLKWIAIAIAVPTVAVVGYAAVTKGMEYFNKKKQDADLKRTLDALKAGVEKRAKDKNKSATEKDVEDVQKKWEEELKKLPVKALTAFTNWFVLTVPYGKDKTGAWAYEVKNPQQGDEFNAKKDALYPKYYKEVAEQTKVQQLFEDFEKTLA